MSDEPLLQINDLKVHFDTDDGVVKAVDGLSLEIKRGEMLGIVGESGSGKSVANMTVLGLTRATNADISGEILFEGRDLNKMPADDLRSIRGNEISMIFQDPLSSLHPFFKVGKQLIEAIQVHQDVSEEVARPAPSSCSDWSASPTPSGGSASTRTSSPAACASA